MSKPELIYVEQLAFDQIQKTRWSYKDKIELDHFDNEVKKSDALIYRIFKGFGI